jgi:hypothetical protein
MNDRQRILTYAFLALFAITIFFVPWRVQNKFDTRQRPGYEFSPIWRPIPFDEGGALQPVWLYAGWTVLFGTYAMFFFSLRSKISARLSAKSS